MVIDAHQNVGLCGTGKSAVEGKLVHRMEAGALVVPDSHDPWVYARWHGAYSPHQSDQHH